MAGGGARDGSMGQGWGVHDLGWGLVAGDEGRWLRVGACSRG